MSADTLFQEMKQLWEQFETSHTGTTKKSKSEARKAIGELKKLVTEYRKSSVNESKS